MIRLSFTPPAPESPWRRTWEDAKQGDPACLTEMDLRYKYFGANVELVVDGQEVISARRFVTLVDLALSLAHAMRRISAGEDAAIGFTESEEVIHLRRDGEERIAVTSSKQPWAASVGSEELLGAFSGFVRDAYARLTAEIPGLGANQVIRRLSPE